MPTEREREQLQVIGFLTLMCVILLTVIGINSGGREEPTPAPEWTNRFEQPLSCELPDPPIICTGELP